MRTLGNILRILRQQSPLTVAREALWRANRRWRRYSFARLVAAGNPGVRLRMVPYYRPNLGGINPDQRRVILQLADTICQGRIPFLSYDTQETGGFPDWSRDFLSAVVWLMESSSTLPIVRFDGSDVKVPWELSRLQFLPILGKAHCLTGEQRYRETARRYINDWIDRNPTGMGVNWMIAMEAALRALSLLFTLNLLSPLRDDEKPWAEKVTRSLWQHLVFIESHLEFSHIVRGNHYLSNLVGLYGLAVFLDGPGMEARRRRYQRLLEREILLHTYEDGGNYEASTGYHVLVTQMFLASWQLMRAAGVEPASNFTRRLRKMLVWIETVAGPSGRLPHVGDCDDGRVEFLLDDLEQMAAGPARHRDSLRVGSLAGLGYALVDANQEPLPRIYADERGLLDLLDMREASWYGVEMAPRGQQTQTATSTGTELQLLPQSGIAVVRRGNAELFFLAVPNGIHGKGTHTHNDKLSVILRFEGEDALGDPGTGCYTRDGATRNRFRSTRAHNTVMVDGREQNLIPEASMGFFSLGNEARVGPIETETHEDGVKLKASHFGYAGQGIIHTRRAEWIQSNSIRLEDRFSGAGDHLLEAAFHAAPGWKVESVASGNSAGKCVLQGPGRMLILDFSAPGDLSVVQQAAGYSRVYGTRVESASIMVRTRLTLPGVLITNIGWSG